MNSSHWGQLGWTMLNSIAWLFKEDQWLSERDARLVVAFVEAFGATLPCSFCRDSFAKIWASEPWDARMIIHRMDIVAGVHRLHNTVNLKLDKPLSNNYDNVVLNSAQCYEQLTTVFFVMCLVIVSSTNYLEQPFKRFYALGAQLLQVEQAPEDASREYFASRLLVTLAANDERTSDQLVEWIQCLRVT